MDLQSLKIERTPRATRRRGSPWPLRLTALVLVGVGAWLFGPQLLGFADRMRLPQVRTHRVSEVAAAAAAAVRGTAANGYVVAARRAALSSDVPGRIVALNVREGSVVKKGDIVAQLYADEYRAALLQADAAVATAAANIVRTEQAALAAAADSQQAQRTRATAAAQRDEAAANLVFAVAELQRAQDLFAQGIGPSRDVEQKRSEHDMTHARHKATIAAAAASDAAATAVEKHAAVAGEDVNVARSQHQAALAAQSLARATLDKTDVRAPFDGIVVLKDAEVGEVVSPNAQGGGNARGAICTMVDFDSLEVQANVPETTLASVRIGGGADVFLDAFPEQRFDGVVDRIWPTADRQKATVEVRVRLLQKDERFRPEMGVRVVFRTEDDTGARETAPASRRIVVPEEAIVRVAGEAGAFVVEGDTVRFTAVSTGESKGGRIAIDAGLKTNQWIVLDPPPSLRDGDRVLRSDK